MLFPCHYNEVCMDTTLITIVWHSIYTILYVQTYLVMLAVTVQTSTRAAAAMHL